MFGAYNAFMMGMCVVKYYLPSSVVIFVLVFALRSAACNAQACHKMFVKVLRNQAKYLA